MTRNEMITRINEVVSNFLGFKSGIMVNSYNKERLQVILERAERMDALTNQAKAIRAGALGSIDEQGMSAMSLGWQCEYTEAHEKYYQLRHEATEIWHRLCI